MTDEKFWALIDQARAGSDASADPKRMRALLKPLSDDEVSAFGLALYTKVCDLNNWALWGAGYIIAGGMSDDSFHYFRTWIVGKGRAVFDIALTDPDTLGPYIDDPEVENEVLEYVAVHLLEERGSGIDPRELSPRTADDEPEGEPFEEETVAESFPKLAAQFG